MRSRMLVSCAVLALSASSAFAAIDDVRLWTTDDQYRGGNGRGSAFASDNIVGNASINLRQTLVANLGGVGGDDANGAYNFSVLGRGVGFTLKETGVGNQSNVVRLYSADGTTNLENRYINEQPGQPTVTADRPMTLRASAKLGPRVYVLDSGFGPNDPTSEIRVYRGDNGKPVNAGLAEGKGVAYSADPGGDGRSTAPFGTIAKEAYEAVATRGGKFLVIAENRFGGANSPGLSVWKPDAKGALTETSTIQSQDAQDNPSMEHDSVYVASDRISNVVYALHRDQGGGDRIDRYKIDSAGIIRRVSTVTHLFADGGTEVGQARAIGVNPRNGHVYSWGAQVGSGHVGEVWGWNGKSGEALGLIASADYGSSYNSISSEFLVTPEPATLGLMVVGGMLMLRRRRKV